MESVKFAAVMCFMLVGCSAGAPPTTTPGAALTSEPAAPTTSPVASSSPTPGTSAAATAPAEACVGPKSSDIDLPPVARQYLAAWNEHDAAARGRILDDIWADSAEYIESPGLADGPVIGRDAMSALIAQNQGPVGGWFEPRAWFEGYAHHDLLVRPWRYCEPDGAVGTIGTDYAELGAEGRIALAVGFSPLTPDGSGVGEQGEAACAGPGRWDWSEVPPIVVSYDAAWNATDNAEREAILEPITDDGTLFAAPWDPSTPVGTAEIAAFIGEWRTPGNYIEFSAWSDSENHDGWFHARWRDCSSTGEDYVEGIEILHVGGDRNLDRVASFASW